MRSSTRAVCVWIALGLLVSAVEARQIEVRGKTSSSGGAITTIDSNGDGIFATLSWGSGQDNFGSFTFTGENEYGIVTGQGACPAGNVEIPYVQGTSVSIHSTGDQSFTRWEPGAACYNLSTQLMTQHLVGHITGGTGRFANVTGTVVTEITTVTLFSDPSGSFGASTGTYTATLSVP
ncbi:MAG: hypothetical protein HY900_22070 [Deltaproteobacteria bacterium]|nr:hypothetical protein [Deltaproteobacteria bacterium]